MARAEWALPVPVPAPLRCLYLDSDLLVLDKPSGLLCVPGKGPDKQDCLSARAHALWPGVRIVHRLDQATSGLVVLARHLAAQRALSAAFAQRLVHKRYLAVVRGHPVAPPTVDAQSWSLIDLPLIADWPRRPRQKVDFLHGKPSQTRWRLLAYDAQKHTSVLLLEPVTGRSHQLRLHLASLGHPILGDALYADPATCARAPRLLLHACTLGLHHPVSGQWLQWQLPAPFALPMQA